MTIKQWIRYTLFALAGAIVLIIGLLLVFAITFNPNDYKPQIISWVKEQKQRTLILGGDIHLAYFPKLGIDLEKISLSERNSTEEFASVDRLRLYLALLPLFQKKILVDEIRIDGLRARVINHKDGTLNYVDLLSGKKEQERKTPDGEMPFAFSVERIKISRSSFGYRDEEKGRAFSMNDLNVNTGKLSSGVPTDVKVSFQVQGNQPKISMDVQLTAGLTPDLKTRHYVFTGLSGEVTGEATGVRNLKISLEGDMEYTPHSIQMENLSLKLSGLQGENQLSGSLNLRLIGDLELKKFRLPRIQANMKVINPKIPKGEINLSVNGSAHMDMMAENVGVDLTTRIDESAMTLKLSMDRFDNPSYVFDALLNKIDADRYLPSSQANQTVQPAEKPEEPFDLSFLKTIRIDGNLRIGELKIYNVKASLIKVGMKARGGNILVSPITASLYKGRLKGMLKVNAVRTPRITLQQDLKEIDVGPLMRDALQKDFLEGKGNISVNVNGAGNTVGAIKKSLAGTAKAELRDGAIKGINIARTIRLAKAKLGLLKGEQAQAAAATEQTDFSELKAVFTIKNGVAHDDLIAKSPLIRLEGKGDIYIAEEKLDYLMKATIVGTLEGQEGKDLADLRGLTIPVRANGPFSDPEFKLDFNAMAVETAKQKVEKKTEEIKDKAQQKLKEGLKKLFKR